MRKLVATEAVSIDGVMESPEEWSPPYSTPKLDEANAAGMSSSDALLLGRVTYEELVAFWPTQPDDNPIAKFINNVPKYVVSTTLEDVEWNNSTLIAGNVEEEIAELKQREGEGIGIVGSRTLVRSLLDYGLLDELVLNVHPLVLGDGKRLFETGGKRTALNLADSKTFDTGVVSLTYQPAATDVEEADA
ncbi:dihydrofolate reductase family protein [Halomarina pelagica]|uniref:dihydrofolate reductase family protein n=1 Tax=Halomarina pelagica TaxID=2961599 RepID=UPI0020C29732|nr:dihydrofolate reductase family protein [Halomarina sp. BND7]